MDTQLWGIAIKEQDSEDALYKALSKSCSLIEKFAVPKGLRVGTMDSLMSLGDDLNKMDVNAEQVAFKVFKQLADIKGGTVAATVEGVPITDYVLGWEWNDAKFQLKSPLRELAETISSRVTAMDEELKQKVSEVNALKTTITQYERKTQGNLMVRGLDDLVSEDDIMESDFMTTVFVVVSKHSYTEFMSSYAKMCDMVVPMTAKLISEDAEFGLFCVIVFKKCVEQFKTAAREKKYMVRDFAFDQTKLDDAASDKAQKSEELTRLTALLLNWCSVNFNEAYGMMMHLKAIKLFVESCMRYGLSRTSSGSAPNFKALLLQPKKGKAEVVRKELAKLYATPGSLLDGDDDIAVPGATGEFFPYVYTPISIDPLAQV